MSNMEIILLERKVTLDFVSTIICCCCMSITPRHLVWKHDEMEDASRLSPGTRCVETLLSNNQYYCGSHQVISLCHFFQSYGIQNTQGVQ